MSFALKKLLGESIQIDWLDVPQKENYWQENSTDHFKALMAQHDVKQYLGYVEADDAPIPPKKYDCIVLAQVMEHFIYNPIPTFKKLATLLTSRGHIYVAVPFDHKFYNVRSWKEMPTYDSLSDGERQRRTTVNNYGHFHEYSYEQAVEIFENVGLEVFYYRWNSPIHYFILKNTETA